MAVWSGVLGRHFHILGDSRSTYQTHAIRLVATIQCWCHDQTEMCVLRNTINYLVTTSAQNSWLNWDIQTGQSPTWNRLRRLNIYNHSWARIISSDVSWKTLQEFQCFMADICGKIKGRIPRHLLKARYSFCLILNWNYSMASIIMATST